MWRSDISLKTLKEDAGFDLKWMNAGTHISYGKLRELFFKAKCFMPIVTFKIGLFMMIMGPCASDLYKF